MRHFRSVGNFLLFLWAQHTVQVPVQVPVQGLLCVVIIFGRCSVINWRRKCDFPGVAGPLGHTGERLQVLQVERSRCKAIASHVDTSKANLMHWILEAKKWYNTLLSRAIQWNPSEDKAIKSNLMNCNKSAVKTVAAWQQCCKETCSKVKTVINNYALLEV